MSDRTSHMNDSVAQEKSDSLDRTLNYRYTPCLLFNWQGRTGYDTRHEAVGQCAVRNRLSCHDIEWVTVVQTSSNN